MDLPTPCSGTRRFTGPRVKRHRLDVDDLVDVEAGHVGGEFRARHDMSRELFGVTTHGVWTERSGDVNRLVALIHYPSDSETPFSPIH